MTEFIMICVLSGTGHFYENDKEIIMQAQTCDDPGKVHEWRQPKERVQKEELPNNLWEI